MIEATIRIRRVGKKTKVTVNDKTISISTGEGRITRLDMWKNTIFITLYITFNTFVYNFQFIFIYILEITGSKLEARYFDTSDCPSCSSESFASTSSSAYKDKSSKDTKESDDSSSSSSEYKTISDSSSSSSSSEE